MKKFFLMLLAASTLTLSFTSCGKDDEEEVTPNSEKDNNDDKPEQPEVIAFEDYSSVIGTTYQSMMSKFGEPEMSYGSFYVYTYEEGNIATLMIGVNPDNNQVYQILEVLNDSVYATEDICAYFASKYNTYPIQTEEYEDEETGEIVKTIIHVYGNAKNIEEATLVIEVADGTVTYTNPQNIPEEPEETAGFDGLTPVDAVNQFLGANINELLEQYGDKFMDASGMYMASVENSDYLWTLALMVTDDVVNAVILLYNEDCSDEDIINYYKDLGYEITNVGVDEETGSPAYIFSDPVTSIMISYSDLRGMAMKIS